MFPQFRWRTPEAVGAERTANGLSHYAVEHLRHREIEGLQSRRSEGNPEPGHTVPGDPRSVESVSPLTSDLLVLQLAR
jgi:hypothetical protein